MRLFLAALMLVFSVGAANAGEVNPGPSIRLGLTAVVVRENLRFLDQWARYLSGKMGQPVEFVRRRSYQEVMDMLASGGLDFAWICGYPFIKKRDPEFLRLLTVPVYNGAPTYHSYIIVHKDSPYKTPDDLKDKVFAFSDPESNSGFLYPRSFLVDKGIRPDTFFRQAFFTYNHAETVEAVAVGMADGGAVDSYIWDYLNANNPEMAGNTRIINRSPAFGFPPLVSRMGVDPAVVKKMKAVFTSMADDPEGRVFLEGLKLDGFGAFSPNLFDGIRQMAERTYKTLPWLASAEVSKKVSKKK